MSSLSSSSVAASVPLAVGRPMPELVRSELSVTVVDPSCYTLPYDCSLCEALAQYCGARPRLGIAVAGVGVSSCVRQFQCRDRAFSVQQTATAREEVGFRRSYPCHSAWPPAVLQLGGWMSPTEIGPAADPLIFRAHRGLQGTGCSHSGFCPASQRPH